jgi:Xaa-Pro aminopeptidase
MKKSTGPALLIGSSETCPDIRHATGLVVPDPVVVLARGARLDVVVSRLEYGRAKRVVRAGRVWTPEMLHVDGPVLRSLGDWALALLRRAKVPGVRVAPDFPLSAARVLEQAGVAVDIAAAGTLRPARMVKTSEEIANIRVAQRAAVAGVQRAAQMIRGSETDAGGRLRFEGRALTSERIKEAIRETVLRYGCIDGGTIVAGGRQGADPHECGSGPLRAGEFIVVDLFPRHLETGYWGDLTRTFMRGAPSVRQRAMYAAVRRAQRLALSMLRGGVKGATVHTAASECLAAAGFETTVRDGLPVGFIHGTGHGVGLEIHEAPSLSKLDVTLRPGMVVTVEPGLYYPELGGVRIEDTVVVTEEGHDWLARCPVSSLEP